MSHLQSMFNSLLVSVIYYLGMKSVMSSQGQLMPTIYSSVWYRASDRLSVHFSKSTSVNRHFFPFHCPPPKAIAASKQNRKEEPQTLCLSIFYSFVINLPRTTVLRGNVDWPVALVNQILTSSYFSLLHGCLLSLLLAASVVHATVVCPYQLSSDCM